MEMVPISEVNWIGGLLGGSLIGLSAMLLLLANGRIAGISGMAGGLLNGPRDPAFTQRAVFLVGLVCGAGVLLESGLGESVELVTRVPLLALAGFLVGLGTRLGGGCTSGHGVCGLARRSARSLWSTLTFMGVAMLTVYVTRHML